MNLRVSDRIYPVFFSIFFTSFFVDGDGKEEDFNYAKSLTSSLFFNHWRDEVKEKKLGIRTNFRISWLSDIAVCKWRRVEKRERESEGERERGRREGKGSENEEREEGERERGKGKGRGDGVKGRGEGKGSERGKRGI